MKYIKAPLMAAMIGTMSISGAPVEAQSTQKVPVETWALRNIINAVQLSPDGRHLLVHKVESREGDYVLEVYNTSDMSKPLRRLAADPMEIITARWVSDNHIFGAAWQEVRKRVARPEQDHRSYKAYFYNLESNKFSAVDGNFGIDNVLPNEPNHILVSSGNAIPDTSGVDPFAAFRPRAYYRFDLTSGARSLVLKGSEKFPSASFDNNGNPRYTSGFDSGTNETRDYFRRPGDGSWKEFGPRYDLDDHENLYRVLGGFHGFQGMKHDDPNIGYVIDSPNGDDKAALYEFDFSKGEIGKKLFQAEDSDVMGIVRHSIPGNDKLVAAVYPGAKRERHWFDQEEKALYESLEKQIPHAHQLSITSRSRDGNSMVVQNSGPHDPGSFWLVRDGKKVKLGSRNPLVKPEQLSDVKYIRYQARDGRTIPGYLTTPNTGKAPYPLVVMHHGGPHVNAVQGYSEIGQMLANNGYMVLYPQNRISTGWGKSHFDAGYGEHGLAMQDDKDDGALHLIEQGLADPDRVAFYGWSYGGYAALVATQRENNIYQCAIAMAAVSDPEKSYLARRGSDSPKALDDWGKRRGTIGINPVNDVAKANIPLLMAHGDVDSRVRYYHYKDYKKALEKAGKGSLGQFLTLKGVDHNNLMYTHQQQLYTKMLDFLANDCGPDGL